MKFRARLRRMFRSTPPAAAAAHHPLPPDTGPPTVAWELPVRHTHRDPRTGRYTRREQ